MDDVRVLRAFAEGKTTRAHEFFGAHPRAGGAVDFAVWAPRAKRVSVIGAFNAWKPDVSPLEAAPGSGVFTGRVHGAKAGDLYKYRIVPAEGPAFDKADPYAVLSEIPPGTASMIAAPEHAWGDAAWMAARRERARLDQPMSIYEVHLGSWRRVPEEGDRPLTYREMAKPLADHVTDMGFSHVELLPLLEHPFYGSWGYGVTGFFSATHRYGTPEDLMFLVDTLHQRGIGVIFDWVPAHFARDAHGLVMFDGAPLFEPDDPARAVHPEWQTGMFDYARPEVRSFLFSSASYWIETFHADGLRIDGVESILYLDHGKQGGIASTNAIGGRENLEGIAFLRDLTQILKIEHPDVWLIAEDASAWPGVTRSPHVGGLGFDLKWDMGFSHDMRRYLGFDPLHRAREQGMLTFRSVYASNEAYVIPLSHDEVIRDRGGALVEQMHGDAWQKLANLRLLYAMVYAQPGKKLLFMGNELGQPRAWHHDRSLDWHLAKEPRHEGIMRLVADLNRLHKERPALHCRDAEPGGFEWIDASNAEMSVVAFERRGPGDTDEMVCVFNFTPVPRPQYRVGVSRSGPFREVLNTDARHYGGSGHGNMGGATAVPFPWNERRYSIVVTVPPLGAIFLEPGS
jgi:1,4-alpha-glucan branching enzyme